MVILDERPESKHIDFQKKSGRKPRSHISSKGQFKKILDRCLSLLYPMLFKNTLKAFDDFKNKH